MRALCGQVTVQMQVDRSRFISDAVVRGELDVALVGGEVPAESHQHLQVSLSGRDLLLCPAPATCTCALKRQRGRARQQCLLHK